jgi:membrane protein implicated in regulation of membrane protease activity
MILILTYIALICGGLLLIILLLSIIGGLDLDLGFDLDVDADGLGPVKSVLTFLSVGAWVVRLVLISEANPVLAFAMGAAAGAVGVWILSLLLKFLLSQQSNVNWSVHDAIMERGTVYLRIPAGEEGIVQVSVKGTKRELKARSRAIEDIPTGASIIVEEIDGDGIVIVSPTIT